MTRISFTVDTRSTLRPIIIGVVIGIILSAVEVLTPPNLPDLLLIVAYAAVVILISAPFVHSTLSGLLCGIVTLVTQTVVEMAYYGSIFGPGLAAAVLTGTSLFIYKLAVFPIAGMLAGYLSRKL